MYDIQFPITMFSYTKSSFTAKWIDATSLRELPRSVPAPLQSLQGSDFYFCGGWGGISAAIVARGKLSGGFGLRLWSKLWGPDHCGCACVYIKQPLRIVNVIMHVDTCTDPQMSVRKLFLNTIVSHVFFFQTCPHRVLFNMKVSWICLCDKMLNYSMGQILSKAVESTTTLLGSPEIKV